MQNSISDHELAGLQAKFILPVIVHQMLRDIEPLDEVAEYTMEEMLTELRPDAALLCLALCAQHVADASFPLPGSRALAVQCDEIIEEYGPMWLANQYNPIALDDNDVKKILSFIPEDLESLRDHLNAVAGEMDEDHCIPAILCSIFSSQAEEHRLNAEIELARVNVPPQSREIVELAEQAGPNVIPFPASVRLNMQVG